MVIKKLHQSGLSYLAMLFIVAVLAIMMTQTYEHSATLAKRQKEKELLFIGNQYRQALTSYYNQSPGGFKELPQKLDDLLSDNRFVEIKRHLRKRYLDPMTGKDWAVVLDGNNRITAVYSLSNDPILQTAAFAKADLAIDSIGKKSPKVYSEVKFQYIIQKEEQKSENNTNDGLNSEAFEGNNELESDNEFDSE